MPKYQHKPMGPAGWMVLALLAFALIYILFSEPKAVSVVLALLLFSFLLSRRAERRKEEALRFVAASREGESICEFARAFDPKVIDTWIIRAVYEQLQKQLEHVHPAFPIRAEDRLKEDLHLDDDGLDMDIAVEVEERTRRSLGNTAANPYLGNVRTVRDLVLFFQAQPRRGAA
jgi:hypothetical protein